MGNGNIRNYYHNRLDARLTNSDYWDLFLAPDEFPIYPAACVASADTSLIVYFDFNEPSQYYTGATSADTIYSLSTWDDASVSSSGVTLNDIGLTGIDNGYVTFNKLPGETGNTSLVSAYTGTTIVLPSGDTRLCLTRVTGLTDTISSTAYTYPIDIVTTTADTGDYAQLCGGFYQGFYKLDGFDYQTMPNRYEKAFVIETWLNKSGTGSTACSGYTGTTLNDTYPDNKGFFYFMGARAENKFWNIFSGNTTGSTCGSGATSGCTIPKETNTVTSTGIPLSPPFIFFTTHDNQFLIYDRTESGYTACNFTGDSITVSSTTIYTDSENQFLIYDRTESGYTACNYTGRTTTLTELDYLADDACNAFGLRIRDDGSVGYRMLTLTGVCSADTYVTGITVTEDYSASGLVQDDQWTHLAAKFVYDYTLSGCSLETASARTGDLMFYINGRLKHIFRDVKEIIPKRLMEHSVKQEGVPFNISIGGGSQGLIDSMTLDGPDYADAGLPIEKYFAGSFIGGISQFRIYKDNLYYCEIKNHFTCDDDRYGIDPYYSYFLGQ